MFNGGSMDVRYMFDRFSIICSIGWIDVRHTFDVLPTYIHTPMYRNIMKIAHALYTTICKSYVNYIRFTYRDM